MYTEFPETVIVIAWWVHLLCIMGPVALCFALWGLLPKRRRQWCQQHKARAILVYFGVLFLSYQAWADKVDPEPPEPATNFVFKLYKELNGQGIKFRPVLWPIRIGD